MTDKEKIAEIIDKAGYLCQYPGTMARILVENGVTISVRCKDCKHWKHMEGGMGDCTSSRFRLPGHAAPTMNHDDFCSCGERNNG
jgi:hypothetical protein